MMVLAISYSAFSQDKLVLDDRTGLLTSEVEALLSADLSPKGITYTTVVDFKERCAYYFSVLSLVNNDVLLTVKDCNDKILGVKNLGNLILTRQPAEKSFLLSYNFSEIMADPGKYSPAGSQTVTEAGKTGSGSDEESTFEISDHRTRYFFAPSAYILKEGELYYNTVYFLLHDIQYGLSDNFSVGLGTSVIGLPIYLTPKVSFPVGEHSAFALGDMFIFGTYGTEALGNLVYGSFSTGGPDGNTTIGAGYLATNESDLTAQTSSLVVNLNGMARASDRFFLMTENYVFGINTRRYAYLDSYNAATDTWSYLSEEYVQRQFLWYGIAGIRIISKNQDFVSWQIGITYVINFPGKVPVQYASWQTSFQEGINAIAFPAVSYTRKFGKKY